MLEGETAFEIEEQEGCCSPGGALISTWTTNLLERSWVWKKAIERYGPLPFADGLPAPKEALFGVLEELKNNAASGATVALVNIPLSISLGKWYINSILTSKGIAAGATPGQGLVTAVWSGLCFGLLGGSNYNVVGPTGDLLLPHNTNSLCRGTLWHLVSLCHSLSNTWRALLLGHLYWYTGSCTFLTFLAVLLFITWVLRLDKYLIFIPTSVMLGFSVGVALIIGLNQIPFGFGLKGRPRHLTPRGANNNYGQDYHLPKKSFS